MTDTTKPTNQPTPAGLRAQADAARQRVQESWERSDTDGFLSQWANSVTADKLELEARILENGGQWEFPALFDLEGKRVPAKLIWVSDRFRGFGKAKRPVWMLCDPTTGQSTGQFVNPSTGGARSIANLRAKGYVEGTELAPAKADLRGSDRCNVRPVPVRTDRGWC